MIRIDAHQHFWRLARGDYAWLTPDLAALYRDFEPADLAPHLVRAGVDRTVAVQAAPTLAETRYLLDLADATDWIAGVVGWVDLADPSASANLAALASHRAFRGIRPMLQDLPDPAWMLRDDLTPAYEALVESGLGFDALVRPEHLRHLDRLIERFPALRVVVDHAAKPSIASRSFEPWAADIAQVASHRSVVCKLSGLATEAETDWTPDALRAYVDHLLDCFGAERLLWGSDWPVVELAGGYERWHRATGQLLGGLSDAERDAILGGNAARFYRLDE